MTAKKKQMLLTGLLVLLALTALSAVLLRGTGVGALDALRAVPPRSLALLAALEAGYQLLDALACRTVVRTRAPGFGLRQAWEVVHLNIFGDIASCGAASAPMQSYALHRCGLPVGAGLGLMTLRYVFHKLSVMLYASALLAAQWPWLKESGSAATRYLALAYLVSAAISVGLALLCTWGRLQRLALRLAARLPDTGKWAGRKGKLCAQLDALYAESRRMLRNKACCARLLALNTVKLSLLCAMPWVCMRALGLPCPGFAQMQLLSSLMLLLTGVLPNVAGVGPTEFAFLLLFAPYAGQSGAALALVLYRAFTYYLPFLVSIGPFCQMGRW